MICIYHAGTRKANAGAVCRLTLNENHSSAMKYVKHSSTGPHKISIEKIPFSNTHINKIIINLYDDFDESEARAISIKRIGFRGSAHRPVSSAQIKIVFILRLLRFALGSKEQQRQS